MYNNSRPLSADDIQKAEMRAMFMQEKYGKVFFFFLRESMARLTQAKCVINLRRHKIKNHLSSSTQMSIMCPEVPSHQLLETTYWPKPINFYTECCTSPDNPEIMVSPKLNIAPREAPIEKLDSKRIRWQIPPGIPLLCASLSQFLRMLDLFRVQ